MMSFFVIGNLWISRSAVIIHAALPAKWTSIFNTREAVLEADMNAGYSVKTDGNIPIIVGPASVAPTVVSS